MTEPQTTPAHAPFAPSAMERIALCPGSFLASAGVVEETSDYALDGTEAHELLSWCIHNQVMLADAAQSYAASPVHKWTHRHDTQEERLESVQAALDELWNLTAEYPDAIVYTEKRVTVPSIFTEDCWGTADIIVIIPSMKMLAVVDFKHGAGKLVHADGNLQLNCYALGAYSSLVEGFEIERIVSAVVQPRAWSPDGEAFRFVEYTAADMPRLADEIDQIILNAQNDTTLVPGKVQCQFCPRRMDCKARETAAVKVASDQFRNIRDVTQQSLAPPDSLSLEQIAYVLSLGDMLTDWVKDVTKRAEKLALNGMAIPGFKLVEPMSRRQYTEDYVEASQRLELLTGIPAQDFTQTKMIAMGDAEKTLRAAFAKAGIPKLEAEKQVTDVMAQITERRPVGGPRLVPQSDPRPGIKVGQANFGGVLPPPKT